MLHGNDAYPLSHHAALVCPLPQWVGATFNSDTVDWQTVWNIVNCYCLRSSCRATCAFRSIGLGSLICRIGNTGYLVKRKTWYPLVRVFLLCFPPVKGWGLLEISFTHGADQLAFSSNLSGFLLPVTVYFSLPQICFLLVWRVRFLKAKEPTGFLQVNISWNGEKRFLCRSIELLGWCVTVQDLLLWDFHTVRCAALL